MRPQDGEEPSSDLADADHFSRALSGQRQRVAVVGRDLGEDRVVAAPIGEVRRRHGAADAIGLLERGLVDAHERVRIRIRQRPQQHGIHRAKDRGRAADADRQRQHRDERESGLRLAVPEAHV